MKRSDPNAGELHRQPTMTLRLFLEVFKHARTSSTGPGDQPPASPQYEAEASPSGPALDRRPARHAAARRSCSGTLMACRSAPTAGPRTALRSTRHIVDGRISASGRSTMPAARRYAVVTFTSRVAAI